MSLPNLSIINGYQIAKVKRVVGIFWAVRGTGRSFLTLGDAERFATAQPTGALEDQTCRRDPLKSDGGSTDAGQRDE